MATSYFKIAVRGRLPSGDEWRNIFYQYDPLGGDYVPSLVADMLDTLYGGAVGALNNGVSIYGADISTFMNLANLKDPRGWSAADFVPHTITGTASGDCLPPADCYLILAKTGTKRVIGRKFIPGVPEAAQNNGVVGSSTLTALQTLADAWMDSATSVTANSNTPAVWGVRHGFTAITSVKVDDLVFHLRRRQQGHGI